LPRTTRSHRRFALTRGAPVLDRRALAPDRAEPAERNNGPTDRARPGDVKLQACLPGCANTAPCAAHGAASLRRLAPQQRSTSSCETTQAWSAAYNALLNVLPG